MERTNRDIIIDVPLINDTILLEPYPKTTVLEQCKIFCRDLLDLVIPLICILGSIIVIIIMISEYIK